MVKGYENLGLPGGSFAVDRRCRECDGGDVHLIERSPFHILDGGPSTLDDISSWGCRGCGHRAEGYDFIRDTIELPYGWWYQAERAARSVRRGQLGRDSLYVALLRDAEANKVGLYVGTTGLAPNERYERHKAGIQAGRGWVQKYGVGLIPDLTDHLPSMSRPAVLEAEQNLIEAFRTAGIEWVQGA